MLGRVARRWPHVAILVLFILGWEFLVDVLGIPRFIIAKPSDIALALINTRFPWETNTFVTIEEVIAGFALAVVSGIGLALLMSSFKLFRELIWPYLVALQILPKIALAPVIVIVVGFGLTSNVLIAYLVAFFPIIIDTLVGLQSVRTEIYDVIKGYHPRRLMVFTEISFPAALPNIFAGLKVSITLAVIGAVVGEFLGGSSGLGYLLVVAMTYADLATAFGAVVLLSIIGIGFYVVIVIVERRLLPWYIRPRELGSSE